MPQFNAKVVSVDNNGQPIWSTPDGQRHIWQVTIEANGKRGQLKTYSGKIAQVGFEGQIETYEKPNSRGQAETFIKQPQQEGFTHSAPTTSPSPQSNGNSSKGYTPKDDAAIKAMWAIGQANVYHGPQATPDKIERAAVQLFHMVDRVKVSTAPDVSEDPKFHLDGPVEELSQVFGDDQNYEVLDNRSDPWNSQNPNQTQLPL